MFLFEHYGLQGVRNSHGVQLFRLVRVVSGEEDDLLKPGLMSSDSAALGTSAATGVHAGRCVVCALCADGMCLCGVPILVPVASEFMLGAHDAFTVVHDVRWALSRT